MTFFRTQERVHDEPDGTSTAFSMEHSNSLSVPAYILPSIYKTPPAPFGATVTVKVMGDRLEFFAGFRVAVDRDRHLWFGGTVRRLYNFGPGPKQWTILSGDAVIRFGR